MADPTAATPGDSGSDLTNANPPSVGSKKILKTGILTKYGGNVLDRWKTRFFVLSPVELIYFQAEKDWLSGSKPLGRLAVSADFHCESVTPADLEWKFVCPEKTVIVRSSIALKAEWYEVIDAEVKRIVEVASKEGKPVPRKYTVTKADDGAAHTGRPSISVSTLPVGKSAPASSGTNLLSSTVAEEDDGDENLFSNGVRESGVSEGDGVSLVRNSVSGSNNSSNGEPISPTSASKSPTSKPRGGSTLHHRPSFSTAATSALASEKILSPAERASRDAKRQRKNATARALFGWPADEAVLQDYSCALEKGIMLHGKMYVSQHFVSFYSNIFSEVKVCIPVADIISVCLVNQALIFPNAIKIFVRHPNKAAAQAATNGNASASAVETAGTDNEGQKPSSRKASRILGIEDVPKVTDTSYFFGSFGTTGRSRAFHLISSLIDGTFDAEEFARITQTVSINAIRTQAADAAAAKAERSLSSSAPGSMSSIADGDEEEDDEEEEVGEEGEFNLSSSGSFSAQKDRIDFGVDLPSHEEVASSGGVDMQPMVDVTFPDINAKTFWRLFLSDMALYTAEAYHTSRGDTEYNASIWKEASTIENSGSQSKDLIGWNYVRDQQVRVKVVGSPMGPDTTRVLKVQKYRQSTNTDGGVSYFIETIAVTPDVPFGSDFFLRDQWKIEDLPNNGGVKVSITLGIKITSSSWKLKAIRSMLIQRALGDNKKGFEQYVSEMKSWMDSHKNETELVKKMMSNSNNNANASSNPGASPPLSGEKKSKKKKDSSAAPATEPTKAAPAPAAEKATPPTPAATAQGQFGPLQPYVEKLPPQFQTVPAVAGMGFVLLILVYSLILSPLFFPSSSSSSAATSSSSPSSSSSSVGGTSWSVTILITLLMVGVAFLASKIQALEVEVARLTAEVRVLKNKQ